MKCPACNKGDLKKGMIKEYISGTYIGKFPAEICTACNESFTDSETTKKIKEVARKKLKK